MTASGDSEVRVFDLQHSGSGSPQRSGPHTWTHHDQSACTRVIKCHSDRVKRIATEDSPDVFLTVSEDGTVRQHDLRTTHTCRSPGQRSGAGCGPALASYPGLTLYSLSCSSARPWLFVVAGTNPYAFLHDRRMVRHEVRRDWGLELEPDGLTQCVRRFGLPEGTRGSRQVVSTKLGKGNGGRDLLVSYSGGKVWLFDTDAEAEPRPVEVANEAGKRKRSGTGGEADEGKRKTRRGSQSGDEDEDDDLAGDGPAFSTIDVDEVDEDEDRLRMRLVPTPSGQPTIMASARRAQPQADKDDSSDPDDYLDEVDDYAEFEDQHGEGAELDEDDDDDDEESSDEEEPLGPLLNEEDEEDDEEEEGDEQQESEGYDYEEEDDDPRSLFGTRRRTFHDNVPLVHPHRSFAGHRNVDTVKDVNFVSCNVFVRHLSRLC